MLSRVLQSLIDSTSDLNIGLSRRFTIGVLDGFIIIVRAQFTGCYWNFKDGIIDRDLRNHKVGRGMSHIMSSFIIIV